MKKSKGLAYATLLIIFILFNIIAYVVPTEKKLIFWIAYAFSFIVFALQIVFWNIAFKGEKTMKSKYLGISLIAVGTIYLTVQLAVFVIFMVFSTIASWIAVVACSLILGISLICLIGTEVARDEITRVDSKVEKKVFYIKSLQGDVELLANLEHDDDVKDALLKLAEAIRFSDPIDSECTRFIEKKIVEKLNTIKESNNPKYEINEIMILLKQRNKLSKNSK